MSPKIVDKISRRRELASAAQKVFLHLGFEKTSMEELARHLGVGKGTLYEYFSCREDLIIAAHLSYVRRAEDELHCRLARENCPKRKLQLFFQLTTDHIREHPEFFRMYVTMIRIFTSELPEASAIKLFQDSHRNCHATIRDILLEGSGDGTFRHLSVREADLIATNILAYQDGILMHFIFGNQGKRALSQVKHFFRTLLKNLAPVRRPPAHPGKSTAAARSVARPPRR